MSTTIKNINFEREIILYKYISAETLESIIQDGKIKATQLSYSNDPMEFLPSFNSEEDYCTWNQTINNCEPLVICLSSKMSSPAMWGHYTDGHKGLCLAFKFKIEPYKDTPFDSLELSKDHAIYSCLDTLLFKVVYSKLRTLNANDEIKNTDHRIKGVIFRCIASKSDEWTYEQEYRLLIQKINHLLTVRNGMFFYSGMHKFLTGIIIGRQCKFSDKYIATLLNNTYLKDRKKYSNYDNITISKAQFSLDTFSIKANNFSDSIIES